jgi:hypothetical protein
MTIIFKEKITRQLLKNIKKDEDIWSNKKFISYKK